jgi:hypothetical protein
MKFHEDGTLPKETHHVWVFGSNEAGIHGSGAAKVARDLYKRPMGNGLGPYVNQSLLSESWAIPTKDKYIQTLPLDKIKFYIDGFKAHVIANPGKTYFITRIGCVLAGYTNEQIAPLFKGFPPNCDFPEAWREYIQ